jgi:riboflavin kinase / FMN adenylyltransferase
VLRWRGIDGTPSGWGRCVVTIGVFDGVHRGHQALIGRALSRARELGLPLVLVTFDPHPSEVVRPGSHPPVLTPVRRKAELVEELGVDAFCVLPFTT